ncbi:hypothetical protein ABZW10_32120 [Kitasatospora sp. NPDC004723]|uniref:hypothetical protein n=1 Tax=Kitasatospora sp. NPDC004723 TaxID=3154288 RepID=UPI0033A334BC
MRLRRVHGVAAAVVLTGLLTGCAFGTGDGRAEDAGPEPEIGQIMAEPLDGARVALPLDGYSVSAEESAVIFRAMGRATQTCMRAKGFDYDPGEVPVAPPSSPFDPGSLGLLSAAAARQTGYHKPPGPAGSANGTTGSTAAGAVEQSEAYRQALTGTAGVVDAGIDRGCMGEIELQFRAAGVGSGTGDLVGSLRAKAYDRTAADSRVKAAISAWQSCMAGLGHHYDDPARASAAGWPDPVSEREKATAVADMNCKTQVGLLGTWYTVQTAYQEQFIGQNEAALQAVKERSAQRVAAARKLLGQG